MIKTLSQSEFIEETNKFSESYRDKFTYEGKQALFDYFENYEEETGEKIEFDYIALCCDYTEYNSFEEFQDQYQKPEIKNLEDLNEHTTVIEIDNAMKTDSFIIREF